MSPKGQPGAKHVERRCRVTLRGLVLEGGGEQCLWADDMLKNATASSRHAKSRVIVNGHICKFWATAREHGRASDLEAESTGFTSELYRSLKNGTVSLRQTLSEVCGW